MCKPARIPQRLMLSVLALTAWIGATAAAPVGSVTVIGDVHGDFVDFVAILQRTGLIDKENHWAGGKATFVQVGDLLDRGPKPRDVMDLVMTLEKEAPKDGGRVEALLGNHEMMNIMGDLRYVTSENYASFADPNSEERRRSAYKDYVKWRERHTALLSELAQPLELTEAEWMARHPAGFIEQREAFSPNGAYGKWLRSHNAVTETNGIIFLHGGISPAVASMGKVSAINSRIHEEIGIFDSCKQYLVSQGLLLPFFNLQELVSVIQAEFSAEQKSKVPSDAEIRDKIEQLLRFPSWLSVRSDGPLWFRGYDQWSDEEGSAQIDTILRSLKADRFVIGHTVQKQGRQRERFGGKIFLIDTGMLNSYYPGGRASALEIENNVKFTAEYMGQKTVLFESARTSQLTGSSEQTRRAREIEWISPSELAIAFEWSK
jgi:hypothetical protein